MALKESPAAAKGFSLKKKTSCGHRSDTFINSAHVPHFLFFFEVMQAETGRQRQRGRQRRGLSDFSLWSDNIPSGWSGSHSEQPQ